MRTVSHLNVSTAARQPTAVDTSTSAPRDVPSAASVLVDLDPRAAARAETRLRDQTIIWLTTVDPEGQPQTSPVGYVWDGTTVLILTNADARKVRNLGANPKVALHLDLDDTDDEHSVLTIEGIARMDPATPDGPAPLTDDETSAYLEKHLESMNWAGITPPDVFQQLSTVIRVTPTRARSY